MKKFVALVLVLALALTCFAGCSSSSSSSQAGGSSAATGGSDSGKQLSGKVVYWSMYNEGEPEAMAIEELFFTDHRGITSLSHCDGQPLMTFLAERIAGALE